MANNNNIPQFSAADIEKYHQGLLSDKERHDLEKAALDDPFLADALEGYAVAGVDMSVDMADLTSRLAERTSTAKVIPLSAARRDSFRLLRAAVIIAFVAGASLLVYQFGFNKKNDDIAEVKNTATEKIKPTVADTNTNTPATTTDNSIITPETDVNPTTASTTPAKGITGGAEKNKPGEAITTSPQPVSSDVAPVASSTTPSINQPAKTFAKEDAVASSKVVEDKDGIRDDIKKRSAGADAKQEKEVLARKQQETTEQANRAVAINRNAETQNRYQQANIFRGRVTDGSNNGVPFANVTNAEDNNAGTYTDAKGFFNLTSPDSVLNVEVRSIGFEHNQAQLRNSVPNNQVVLQDDRKSLSEVIVSTQKPNAAARSNSNNIKVEEPEPADGWDKYDSYLANNLKAPEDFKPKQSNNPGTVEVSFEVDKNGEPTNFKIEKSLCATCDKEAIRLIKEGPKWNRKVKKGRTTVKINF